MLESLTCLKKNLIFVFLSAESFFMGNFTFTFRKFREKVRLGGAREVQERDVKWKLSESRTLICLLYGAPEGVFPFPKGNICKWDSRNEADWREDFVWCCFPDFPSQGSGKSLHATAHTSPVSLVFSKSTKSRYLCLPAAAHGGFGRFA